MAQSVSSVDVLVVGAGPAGLVAGIVLGSYGVDVAVVEKRAAGSTLSRALVISTRCMEILRSWGLESEVRAGAAEVNPRAWVTDSLASSEGIEMPLGYPTAAEAAEVSPTRPAWAAQDHLEPILRAHLAGLASARLRFGFEVQDVRQDDRVVRAWARDEESRNVSIEARYVVAADGAHSRTRAAVGIGMDGPDELAEFHRIEFEASLAPIVGSRRFGLYVITNPDVAGVMTPRGRGDRWGLSREWRPGAPRMIDADDAQLRDLIGTAIGDASVPVTLERRSAFAFAAQLAQRYRRGRVFLVGDAAHRMTPRGGTGMNTAIQDAYDLAWRLAFVLRGWATSDLLDDYEQQRRPVGLHNVERARQLDGARRDANDALPWDLNDRLPHRWIATGSTSISTLDLVGPGLTLFAGPDDPRWTQSASAFGSRVPCTARILRADDAQALHIKPRGSKVVGPDAREIARWDDHDALHARPLSAPWR